MTGAIAHREAYAPVIRKGNKLMFMTNSLNRHERITDNISKSRKNNQKT